MNAKGRRLMKGILDDPTSDQRRLAYADWLAKSGQPARAEFIRLQIRRSSLAEWDHEHLTLRLRELALLKEFDEQWRRELPSLPAIQWGRYDRGFVSAATVEDWDTLLHHGKAMFGALPIQSVEVSWPEPVTRIGEIEANPMLEELVLPNLNFLRVGEEKKLLSAPLVSTISRISLPECDVGVSLVDDLFDSPAISRLTALRVPLNAFGRTGIERMLDQTDRRWVQIDFGADVDYYQLDGDEDESFDGDESFDEDVSFDQQPMDDTLDGTLHALAMRSHLANVEIEDEGWLASAASPLSPARGSSYTSRPQPDSDNFFARLAAWTGLKNVETLTLSGNQMEAADLCTLLSAENARSLKDLSLRNTKLDDDGLRAFLEAAPGLTLHRLDLGQNLFSVDGLRALGSAECLSELKWLAIDRCELAETMGEVLATARFLPTICRLNLDNNYLGQAGLAALLGGEPRELHTLRAANNGLGNEGASLIAHASSSSALIALDLSRNQLDDRAVEAFIASPMVGNLRLLRLTDNPISQGAYRALLQSPGGRELHLLDLPPHHDDSLLF